MERNEAIIKYKRILREDVAESYVDPDKYVYINEEDDDLQKWRVEMPECPDWGRIENFGKHAKDQVFVYEEIPHRLLALVDEVERQIKKNKKYRDTEMSMQKQVHQNVWEALRKQQLDYKTEINWIKYQWYHRLYGKWIMIKGKPVYLCGFHWFFLNYWRLEGTGALPEYRTRDMKWFHAQHYAFTTTETVDYCEHVTESGKVIQTPYVLEDGTLRMKDVGYRTIFGTNNLKGRRVGETSKTCAINYDIATRGYDKICGIQGNLESTASDIYEEKLLYAYNRMPFFFVPEFPNLYNTHGLSFTGYNGRSGLNSKIDYATTARKEYYDQRRLDFYHGDECFGKDTKVLMYNGEVKNIQDIKVGDYVIGEDGNKKCVLKTNKGYDQLYKIDYKKGDGFICNGNHILKTSYCRHRRPEYKEVTAEEFYNSSKNIKRHYSMYKSDGVNYSEVSHIIDPYFIGLYIGDGLLRSSELANVDNEIRKYCKEFADKGRLKFLEYRRCVMSIKSRDNKLTLFRNREVVGEFKGYKDCSVKTGYCQGTLKRAVKNTEGLLPDGCKVEFARNDNWVREELKRIGLLYKKFVPKEYLYDSKENRLLLLAGLIDSDGYLGMANKKPKSYEITQVYEHIAQDICFLARSLGFYSSIRKKNTTMKREDGSRYSGEAYRVMIYGDLYSIPCKVKRKIAENVEFSVNRRNPSRFGFDIERIGNGEYYGITVEDGAFLLKDFTVVHNCGKVKLENLLDRHGVVKRCCTEGAMVKGMMIYTSTAEDMDADAGQLFEQLSEDSMFEQRMSNGQTNSGLINVYFPMYESYHGFIDKYGDAITGKVLEDQIEFMEIVKRNKDGEVMGAQEYLESIEKDLADKGDLRGLAQHQRQHPKKFRECFALAMAGNNFNTDILNKRINELKFQKDKKIRTGNYVWTGEPFNSPVMFSENSEGKWEVSEQLAPHNTNQYVVYDGLNKMPRFDSGIIISADAYRFDETDGYRESKGSIAVYQMYNETIDGDKNDARDYVSDRFVATYLYREKTKDLFAEEVLKAALYWNGLVYPEINVAIVQEFFYRRNYRGYLHFDVDDMGYKKKNCGFNTAGPVIKQKMFTNVDTWINLHAHKCEHRRMLEECSLIRGPKYTKDFDLFIAMAGCLLGATSKYSEYIKNFGDMEGIEVGGFFGMTKR